MTSTVASATTAEGAAGARVGSAGAVSVGDLQRAWRAVSTGQFHTGPGVPRARELDGHAVDVWEPGAAERVIPVVGCAGSCGATTVALAIAESVTGRARVVECGSAATSGLAAASRAELGRHASGWVQGTRGELLLQRASRGITGPADVPVPSSQDEPVDVTVLDVAWDMDQLFASGSWLATQVRQAQHVVLVATATVPGLRRLETALAGLGHARAVVAVVGPPRKRWPAAVEHGISPVARTLDRDGRLVLVPADRRLGYAGLDATALPAAVVAAGRQLLNLADDACGDGGPA